MRLVDLNDEERDTLFDLTSAGYVFDWTIRSSDISNVTALVDKGTIAGLVEFERRPQDLLDYLWLIEVADGYKGTKAAGKLLAYVAQDAMDAGFEGFVLFESKSYLYQYYIQAYRAKPVRGRFLIFDTETSRWLIETYLKDDNNE